MSLYCWAHSENCSVNSEGNTMSTLTQSTIPKYLSYALWLALFTILYNFAEGLIAILFGISDGTLTLFSSASIHLSRWFRRLVSLPWYCVFAKIRRRYARNSKGQCCASRAFYLPAVGLGITAIYNVFTAHKPETTLPGLIISVISIAIM